MRHRTGAAGSGTKRLTAVAAALFLLVAVVVLTAGDNASAVQSQPNILIILTDDQSAESVLPGVMTSTDAYFNQGGRRFQEGYATTPVCCPSRASFMSGRYVHNHGIAFNSIAKAEANGRFFDEDHSLQSYLKGAGYKTGLFGKFLNVWPFTRAPEHWDQWGILDNYPGYGCEPVPPSTSCTPQLQAGEGTAGNPSVQTLHSKYATTYLREKAKSFIIGAESQDSQPWLLYVAPLAPHHPRTPERRYQNAPVPPFPSKPSTFFPSYPETSCPEANPPDTYKIVLPGKPSEPNRGANRQCKNNGFSSEMDLNHPQTMRKDHDEQLRTLMSVDDLVRELMIELETRQELNDTLAFFVSDNGWMWGEHWQQSKGKAYRESARIPFYVRGPGAAAIDTSGVAANIDLLPTILSAANVSPDPAVPLDGINLFNPAQKRERILLELINPQAPQEPWAALRTTTYTYIETLMPDDPQAPGDESQTVIYREYYDLVNDPYERFNLLEDGVPANDPSVPRLHARVSSYRACKGQTCPPFVDNSAPRGVDVQTANGGELSGKPDNGDTIKYSFSEPIEPSSLVASWDGTGTRPVTLVINGNAGATGKDTVTVTGVPALGTVDLGRTDYVGASPIQFTGSTLALSEDFKTLTATLGGGKVLANYTGNGTMKWGTSSLLRDLDAHAGVAETRVETGAADREF